ncbi:rRNA N(6)-adenosine-methyltransferase ZCCHC4 isoform X2 [Oratosquilla oratoria]|uniref:rRNA N(6)-adenosine-methyltransferase ZCCHC4 isoform X2 n=2 Tax=Oratosquilla oratoria TaxID=337810 RepID=UPI003F76F2F7
MICLVTLAAYTIWRLKTTTMTLMTSRITGTILLNAGPTIIFKRNTYPGCDGRQFYACAACRDKKDCHFFHWVDEKISEEKRTRWQEQIDLARPSETHSQEYDRLCKVRKADAKDRIYCTTCCQLLTRKEASLHRPCNLRIPVTDELLNQPSLLLTPKESSKYEAQYLFACKSVDVIINLLEGISANKVLCVGAPRIHEAIVAKQENCMSSLMLDIDRRYSAFYSPGKFIQYNMFNHHFFDGEDAKQVYLEFISEGENLVMVTDPPFGGRLELLAETLSSIQNDWRNQNKKEESSILPMFFIFPYFMEPQVMESLPHYTMLDYQVDYDNHPLYSSGTKGMKNGSAVRIFVNLPPKQFPLPEDGYRYCKLCQRWVNLKNKHCTLCKGCMSKDGREYRHCSACGKCVKPSWKHCGECNSCKPQDHKCGEYERLQQSALCFKCGVAGHKRKDCPSVQGIQDDTREPLKKKCKKKKEKQKIYE